MIFLITGGPRILAATVYDDDYYNRRKCLITKEAGNRTRTDDLLITNQLLYQLSYAGKTSRP